MSEDERTPKPLTNGDRIRAMRYYLEASAENMLDGRELDALPSAMEKLNPGKHRNK